MLLKYYLNIMRAKFLLTGMAVLTTVSGFCQFNLQIGQLSDNSYTKTKDAIFQFTNPKEASVTSSWLVNGFLELGYRSKKNHTIGASYELARNTLIQKVQHVEQVGLNGVISISNSTATFEMPLSLTAKYSNNKIEKKEEAQILLSSTFRVGAAKWYTAESLIKLGDFFAVSHNHSVGLASKDFADVIFAQAYGEINSYLFHKFFYDKNLGFDAITLKASWNGRAPIEGELVNGRRMLKYSVGANINFDSWLGKDPNDPKDIYKLGLKAEWTDGADPLKGLQNQKFMIVAMSLIIKQ
jgi:hypothetical protein